MFFSSDNDTRKKAKFHRYQRRHKPNTIAMVAMPPNHCERLRQKSMDLGSCSIFGSTDVPCGCETRNGFENNIDSRWNCAADKVRQRSNHNHHYP